MGVFQQQPKLAGARWVAELAQSFGLNLANALASDGKHLSDLFQSVLRTIIHTEAHSQDLFFPRTESTQHLRGSLLKVYMDDRIGGRDSALVFDEVAEVRIPFLANRRLQRDGHAHDLKRLAH